MKQFGIDANAAVLIQISILVGIPAWSDNVAYTNRKQEMKLSNPITKINYSVPL
jgi:hypothetical protein